MTHHNIVDDEMAEMALHENSILWRSCMIKKSQTKRTFTSENYKFRLFVLFPDTFRYYDPQKHERLKGSIPLNQIKLIEKVDDSALPGYNNIFQIVYLENAEVQVLYIVANTGTERDQWISMLKQECTKKNVEFSESFHPGAWTKTNGRYNCCNKEGKNAQGCKTCGGDVNKNTEIASNRVSQINCNTTDNNNITANMPVNQSKQKVTRSSPRSPDHDRDGSNGSGGSTNSGEQGLSYVAIFDFAGLDSTDLSLKKDKDYEIIDCSSEHWWFAKDLHTGKTGYIPSNYVRKKHDLETYEWYMKDMSRQRCDDILKNDGRVSAFMVRDSISQPGSYTVSVFTGEPGNLVRHYHIKTSSAYDYFVADHHRFKSIPELIYYHSVNSGGLATRTRFPPNRRAQPTTAGLGHGIGEINPQELEVKDLLGRGNFGSVHKAIFRQKRVVAVKLMREGMMSEENFVEEAKTMKYLQHPHLVQLYGVVMKRKPLMIVTEYMPHGSLHSYLRRNRISLLGKPGKLIDMCAQICKGMAFLEKKRFIHRDLAARNCLVGNEGVVKVADFGLARFVIDDEYQSSTGTKFPIKWAPPEVLSYIKFSSKSDVWAFGVLMWEVFTGGEMPYENMMNTELVDYIVYKRKRLGRPCNCPSAIYAVMMECWHQKPDNRPSFKQLEERTSRLCDAGDYVS